MKQTKEQMLANMAKARAARKPKVPVVAQGSPPPPKSDTLAGPSRPISNISSPDPIGSSDGDLFEGAPDDIEVEQDSLIPALPKDDIIPMRPDDGIPPIDTGLTEDEKRRFIDLVDKNMGPEERAERLCDLARLCGSKTAAVGLRAIQEIHNLKRLHGEHATESAPLFVLPTDTNVAVLVQKVEK